MGEPAGLLDTSVFIAREVERPLGELPARVTVSVITIGELELGVLSAVDAASRARRGDTLALARTAEPVPISEAIMGRGLGWWSIAAPPASTGRSRSPTR